MAKKWARFFLLITYRYFDLWPPAPTFLDKRSRQKVKIKNYPNGGHGYHTNTPLLLLISTSTCTSIRSICQAVIHNNDFYVPNTCITLDENGSLQLNSS